MAMRRNFKKPQVMSDDEEAMFRSAEECHICDQQYKYGDIRVRDHCHVTGKYRGSAHQDCNLKLRLNPNTVKIPVIFHNLRGGGGGAMLILLCRKLVRLARRRIWA